MEEPGFYRSSGHTGDLSRFIDRQILQKTEGQHLSEVRVEPIQSEMHSFSILRAWSRIGFDGCFRVEGLVRNGVVAISCPVVTHGSAMSDAIEPNAEALCLAQRADATKGFYPNLLHDVPSVLVSLNQAPHVIKHGPFELPHDFLESLVVTALDSHDEQFPIKLLPVFVVKSRFHGPFCLY